MMLSAVSRSISPADVGQLVLDFEDVGDPGRLGHDGLERALGGPQVLDAGVEVDDGRGHLDGLGLLVDDLGAQRLEGGQRVVPAIGRDAIGDRGVRLVAIGGHLRAADVATRGRSRLCARLATAASKSATSMATEPVRTMSASSRCPMAWPLSSTTPGAPDAAGCGAAPSSPDAFWPSRPPIAEPTVSSAGAAAPPAAQAAITKRTIMRMTRVGSGRRPDRKLR